MSIPLTGLSNGNCNFSTTISPALSTPFSYMQEVVPVDSIIDTKYSTLSVPVFTISTSDISLEQTTIFTITATSLAPLANAQVIYTINVKLIDNPCLGGIAGQPANNFWDQTFIAHSTPAVISFAGINNGEC
jgi:hypothetical protein